MAYISLEGREVRVNNIFCIGRNYAAHAAELGNEKPAAPVVFLKPNSALNTAPQVRLPAGAGNVHYETELVLLIGKAAAAPENIADAVAGCAVGLDLTERGWQRQAQEKGLPWTRAKGFPQAACVSDFVGAQALAAVRERGFSMRLNGRERQHGRLENMIFPLETLLRTLAADYGLHEGDLVFTGTPEGVGALAAGDVLELDLAGLVSARFEIAA
ncbi:2-keto-4-pentenoate hydratase/2-oxohepta-3-ene-1,7-dioic acid hydratase (catechol pathway) [Kingella potus]|uniref:2-keto-4-pentenoate hydratase/2-oxohepta-3-ene-1,7-dioic acid hydratase (Catechol pathway) n=1 Tax=Kingella potus TaxID=265175 RepID=A0A377R0C1_9NEIS|nr:fumarylacetoacetate hydrolase family protein [Kingella potus]STR00445.1 2-keto-4-pentenoate hydratase/2-oxohepta-3-ene-1,7-dioic acid hydratase (catechol pathway) [Kingella potus]